MHDTAAYYGMPKNTPEWRLNIAKAKRKFIMVMYVNSAFKQAGQAWRRRDGFLQRDRLDRMGSLGVFVPIVLDDLTDRFIEQQQQFQEKINEEAEAEAAEAEAQKKAEAEVAKPSESPRSVMEKQPTPEVSPVSSDGQDDTEAAAPSTPAGMWPRNRPKITAPISIPGVMEPPSPSGALPPLSPAAGSPKVLSPVGSPKAGSPKGSSRRLLGMLDEDSPARPSTVHSNMGRAQRRGSSELLAEHASRPSSSQSPSRALRPTRRGTADGSSEPDLAWPRHSSVPRRRLTANSDSGELSPGARSSSPGARSSRRRFSGAGGGSDTGESLVAQARSRMGSQTHSGELPDDRRRRLRGHSDRTMPTTPGSPTGSKKGMLGGSNSSRSALVSQKATRDKLIKAGVSISGGPTFQRPGSRLVHESHELPPHAFAPNRPIVSDEDLSKAQQMMTSYVNRANSRWTDEFKWELPQMFDIGQFEKIGELSQPGIPPAPPAPPPPPPLPPPGRPPPNTHTHTHTEALRD